MNRATSSRNGGGRARARARERERERERKREKEQIESKREALAPENSIHLDTTEREWLDLVVFATRGPCCRFVLVPGQVSANLKLNLTFKQRDCLGAIADSRGVPRVSPGIREQHSWETHRLIVLAISRSRYPARCNPGCCTAGWRL